MVKSSKRSVSNFLRSPKPSRSGFHFRSARESSVESQFLSSSEDQTSPQESSSRLEPSPANASPDDLRRFPRQLLSDTMQWTSPRQTSPMTSPNLPSSNSDRPSSPRSPLPSHSDQISSTRDSQRIRSPIERDSRSPPASNYRPPPSDMGTPAVTTSPDQSRPSAGTSGGSLVEDELSGIHSRHCIHSSYGLTIVSEETSPESKLQASCGSSRQGSPVPQMGSTSEGSSAENETAKSQPSFQGQTSLRPQADKSDNKLPSSKVKLGQSGLFQKPDVDQRVSSPTRLSVDNRTPIPYRQPTPADSNSQTVANAGHTPSTQRRATSGVRHSSLTLSPSISPSFSPVISPLVSPRQSLTSLTPGSQGLFCGLTQPIPWAQSRSGAQSGPSEQSTVWTQPGRRFLMPPMTRRASSGQERTTHADTGRRWSSASGRSVDSCREQDTSEESGPKEDVSCVVVVVVGFLLY